MLPGPAARPNARMPNRLPCPNPGRYVRRCTLLIALLLCGQAAQATDVDAFERCRELRRNEPAAALPYCQEAARDLQRRDDAEQAFEAWMHVAALASHLGQAAPANDAVDQAVLLLPKVEDRLAAFRLARRRGLNAYREAQPVEALARFLEAQAIARALDERWALAISENDLGVIYRRLGSYPAALEHFEASLHLHEANGENDLGALSANIGKLYLELGDHARAETYLQRALASHREHDRTLLEHQTLEELARLAQREQRFEDARDALDRAWQHFSQVRSPRDQIRLALYRVELEHELVDRTQARLWLDRARSAAAELSPTSWLAIELVAATLSQTAQEQAQAYAALREALAEDAGSEPERVIQAHDELARLAQALGRLDEAIVHLREHHRLSAELEASRHGERFDALRVRFDLERLETEHERLAAERAQQDAELARRRAQTILVAVIAAFAVILLSMHFRSRQHRQRLRAAAERAALERRIADSRNAAELLRSDLRSLSWLLDRQQAAALVFDAAGTIRAITSAAAQRLDGDADALHGRPLAEALDPEVARWAQSLVEQASLSPAEDDEVLGTIEFAAGRRALHLQCRSLALEEELGVLEISTHEQAASPPVAVTADGSVDSMGGDDTRIAADPEPEPAPDPGTFRQHLVELMQTSLEAWERTTRKTRIDLAEASGVWRITIDDGRLRVRAMDRYLRLDTLPERPRWREVLRSAYFVLSEAPLEPRQREQIEAMIETVLQQTRRPGATT